MNTIVVNLLGGPGIGKSTMAADLYSRLKRKDINCELITEYAKGLVWEERYKTFHDQIYLFAKQYHRLFDILGKVDIIINDGCLLLTPIYDPENRKCLTELVFNEFYKMNNLNILLDRKGKKFNQVGRIHDETESIKVDEKIENFLKENNIEFTKTKDILDIMELIKDRYEFIKRN